MEVFERPALRFAEFSRANVTKETVNLRKSKVVTGPSSGFDNILTQRDSSRCIRLVDCAFPRLTKGLFDEIRD